MSELMKALQDTVGKGLYFTLTQKDNENVVLAVGGGIASVTLDVPFAWGGPDDYTGWKWKSTVLTADLLIAAVEAMPEEASPYFFINTDEWSGGGLLLVGEWTYKRGRAKEGVVRYRKFLIDCAVIPETNIE